MSESSTSKVQWLQPCRKFELHEILLATENFNESFVIGKGGFGKVYKGEVIFGTSHVAAAIKRLDLMSDQGAAEFWAEVEMLSKLRHPHLVSLIGYCNYEREMILIYEYMPYGKLEDHLHKLGTRLSWVDRLKICIGAARGLDYLHTGTGIEFGVIHRDVKSSNILLNESWEAKISDFGLSRICPTNQPHTYVNTVVKGTFGYLDPSYFATGQLTRKSDVYAFGVVLLEVLCKKRPMDRSLECGLATWAQDSIKEGNLKNIVDSDIRGEISPKCLKEFARIAERCLENHPKRRPTMTEVIFGLGSVLKLQLQTPGKSIFKLQLPTPGKSIFKLQLQTLGKSIFTRMVDVFPPFNSTGENPDGHRNALGAQLDIEQILSEAQHRWLRPAEICEIFRNYTMFKIAFEHVNRPPNGSLFLFDRRVLSNFRKDGHNWRKLLDGKSVGETHERLRVGSIDVLNCYCAHGEENRNFQRRSYSLIKEEPSNIVLVHYRDVKPKVDDYDDDGDVSGVSSVTVETLPPTQLDIYQTKYPEDMVTHNRVLTAISAALEDKSKQFIGIYGLGGVGKTTLAKEVVARLKNTNMFDDVAFTTVSQKVDVEKIKKDLENAKMRMMKGDRILIILDDVWEKLNLEELGIQCGNNYMNCKILLTSRSKEVCRKMSAQSMIHLNLLPTEEAWILFKRVVGGRLETDANLKPVARKVVEECGGLPLLIQAVGNALKDENLQSWESALSQLKEPAASEMERDIEKAFTRLRLSYEYLKSEEAKSCFLLCSFFPEDDDISLEDLVCYLVGLEKFDSIKDARDRVQNAVNILISSGLLLNGKWEGYTKMHDVVRDVALLIASKDENKFLVEAGKGLKEWLPGHNMLESYTGISLMKNWISKLPDYEVHLSSLDIFLVNNNPLLRMISDEFIKGMKEVKVLDMGWCLISHLPQSLKLLTKLRMLNLEENYLFHEISILGEMKELEILILNRTGIKEIPKEIGQLVNLRRLEVSRCRYMTRVAPGVISKLQSLEELCIDLSRMIEGANGCTAEVMKLLKLTFLDLVVKSCEVIPEGFNLEKLNGFVIQIGEYHRDFYRGNELRMSDCYLIISSKHLVIPLLKRIEKVIEVSRPITILNGIQNLNNIMPELYHGGFNKLEHIQLNYCHNVLCLLEDCTRCDGDEGKTQEKLFKELKHLKLWYLDNLEVLWKYECVSLTNLVSLLIEGCDKLERVFTVSVAQGLVNLKKLGIEGCSALEEVIWGGGGGGGDDKSRNVIVFPSLATISLIVLERLKMFFNSTGNCSIEYASLVYVKIHDCESMKIWGLGIHETPNLKRLEMDYVEPIVVDGPFAINEAVKKLWRK